MRKIIITLFILGLPGWLLAQGFNSINGRNHPELEWMVAETEHFRIMYPRHLSGIEIEAAPVAEITYDTLSENLEVTFDEKIRIYLSDEDEIANGFAVPVGNGYTDIWVRTNEFADTFTGREKWLRKVIAHELSHIFHFKAVESNLGLLQLLFGDPLPGFWTEGLAQYQTENWDAQRGDRWLRLSVFDDEMNYLENSSSVNRRLRYAVGNSQLRYFTETYGDSSLAKLFKHRKGFLGFRYHDFESAFSHTTGSSYREFNDEWRKHVNIYYNTLASGMGRADSLGEETVPFSGQFLYDAKYSPGQEFYVTLSLTSLQRPVRRLYLTKNDSTKESHILAEGNIKEGLNWSPDGQRLAYARQTREKNGSLVHDIFIYDVAKRDEKQLTHNRRARFPVFSDDGNEIAYIVSEGKASNIYVRELGTGKEQKLTSYQDDTQLLHLAWNHQRNILIYQRFDEAGDRFLVTLNPDDGKETILDKEEAAIDNRMPVVSPSGRYIAFTSFRDEVPNVFIYDLENGSTRRFTHQFTGAEALQWLDWTSEDPIERLLVKATEDKNRDFLYAVDLEYNYGIHYLMMQPEYGSWRMKSPPNRIPASIPPDSSLVQKRYSYNSFRNIDRVVSLVLPYFSSDNNFGIFGTAAWTEPLGKHSIAGGGNISFTNPDRESYGIITYINNQLYPSLIFSAYKIPGSGQFYGSDYLIEELTGGELRASWPIDWFDEPYRSDRFNVRFRHVLIRPLETITFPGSEFLVNAKKARQTDLRLSWVTKKQRPYVDNIIHPLDGYGIRFMLTGSEKVLGSETAFLTPDFSAYKILPGFGWHRFYLYGRFQVQFGTPLPQDYIGFSRYSNIDWPLPVGNLSLPYSKPERVRGYTSFVSGKQVAFGSLEYRIPILPSLQTSILGNFLNFGQTSLAIFADGGVVWDVQIPTENTIERRLGTGVELKNKVGLGPLEFVHSLGIAQPAAELFFRDEYDLYYQIKASVPF